MKIFVISVDDKVTSSANNTKVCILHLLFLKNYLFIYLVALGLSCGRWAP